MPPYAGVLTDEQLDAILSYVHSVGQTQKDLRKLKAKGRNLLTTMYMNTTGYVTWKDPSGNPAIKPPWGMLHALNLSTGEYEWEIPLGNDEKRQEEGAADTGLEGKSGPIVTAGGLIFIAGAKTKSFGHLKNQPANFYGKQRFQRSLMQQPVLTW